MFDATQQTPIGLPPMTAAEAKVLIATLPNLSAQQRTSAASALSTVARWSGRALTDMPLDPVFLREHIVIRSAAAFNVGPGRKSNVMSDLKHVMRAFGLIDDIKVEISPAWSALLTQIDPHRGIPIIRFGRYCTFHGVGPDLVDASTLMAFELHLTSRTLAGKPRKIVGAVRGLWNWSMGTFPNWPKMRLEPPHNPMAYTQPLTAFGQSYQNDLHQFGLHLGGTTLDDPFPDVDVDGDNDEEDEMPLSSRRPLRQITIDSRRDHARWAASALVASGVPIEQIINLHSLVQPKERVRTILTYLYERAGKKPSAAGQHVANVLLMISKYYVKLPRKEIVAIQKWRLAVQLKSNGMTDKNKKTTRDVLTPEREANLLVLSETLMKAARELVSTSPLKAAGWARSALAIEILTKFPVRLKNLRMMQLDKHMHRRDMSRTVVTDIDIHEDEVKNDKALSLPVPQKMASMIEEWNRDFRPILAQPGSPLLFPGGKSAQAPMTPQGMRDAIKAVTRDHLGVTVTPQQFRHIAACMFLAAFPGHFQEAALMLGDTVESLIKWYSHLHQASALKRLDGIMIDKLLTLSAARKRAGRGR